MSIQRQYRLPNCGLILEGFNSEASANSAEGRPILSILTNAKCGFQGKEQTLSGGRELLDNLVGACSAYSQQFLSGLPHPQPSKNTGEWVSLEPTENGLHRLTWQSEGKTQKLEITTIELFDLTEAIDQFLKDSSTLPDLKVELKPVSRRDRTREESLVERATPASLGLGTLAAAAIALSLIPLPPPRPVEPNPQANPSQTTPTNPTTTPQNPPQTAPSNPNTTPQNPPNKTPWVRFLRTTYPSRFISQSLHWVSDSTDSTTHHSSELLDSPVSIVKLY